MAVAFIPIQESVFPPTGWWSRNHEPADLDPHDGGPGVGDPWTDDRFCLRLRQSVKGDPMTLFAALVALLLFVYLLAALLRPEWF